MGLDDFPTLPPDPSRPFGNAETADIVVVCRYMHLHAHKDFLMATSHWLRAHVDAAKARLHHSDPQSPDGSASLTSTKTQRAHFIDISDVPFNSTLVNYCLRGAYGQLPDLDGTWKYEPLFLAQLFEVAEFLEMHTFKLVVAQLFLWSISDLRRRIVDPWPIFVAARFVFDESATRSLAPMTLHTLHGYWQRAAARHSSVRTLLADAHNLHSALTMPNIDVYLEGLRDLHEEYFQGHVPIKVAFFECFFPISGQYQVDHAFWLLDNVEMPQMEYEPGVLDEDN